MPPGRSLITGTSPTLIASIKETGDPSNLVGNTKTSIPAQMSNTSLFV